MTMRKPQPLWSKVRTEHRRHSAVVTSQKTAELDSSGEVAVMNDNFYKELHKHHDGAGKEQI